MKRIAIIGSGVAGSTMARVFAEAGYSVIVYEKRDHVGGNCFDQKDETGVLVHRYGPHYFRSNSEEVIAWLSRFTEWIPGHYYVRVDLGDQLVPFPVSLSTMTQLKGKLVTEPGFEQYLMENREAIESIDNAEEQCLSLVGRELYETFFRGYTAKQWGTEAAELDPSVTARIPLRKNFDEKYPQERYQVMPKDGYTEMFRRMLDHSRIEVKLNTELSRADIEREKAGVERVVYTGPIDKYFEYRLGKLDYRSLRFEWKHVDAPYVQPCVQINYPNAHEYTRTVEIKHVTGQISSNTTVCYEYPSESGEPFYPILNQANKNLLNKYRKWVRVEEEGAVPVHFIGRLAEFRYYNMDHIFLKALKKSQKILQLRDDEKVTRDG